MGPATSSQTEPSEIRLALALNGGVSLAIWIGGVANEVLRLCRGVDPYAALLKRLNLTVRADVLTGASAGGLNAVFLALGQLYQRDSLRELREVWVDRGAFDLLLRHPLKTEAPSLMKGDDYFLVELRRALASLIDAEGEPIELDIDVQLTVTSLNGEIYEHPDDFGGVLRERDHRATITFTRKDFAPGEGNLLRLARACRSTASFPGAFEASFVRAHRGDVSSPQKARYQAEGAFEIDRHIDGIRADRFVLDGGVLVNLPVGPAIEAVFNKTALGEVRRILALVIPDPSMVEMVPADKQESPPDLTAVVGASASGIPRAQSVRQFLEEVRSHNDDVRIIQRQRLALLTSEEGVGGLERLAKQLFDSYRLGRLAASAAEAREELSELVEDLQPSPTAAQVDAWRRMIQDWFSPTKLEVPWVPADDTALQSPVGWGVSVILRSCGRLLHLIREIGVEGQERATLKEVIHVARETATRIADKDLARILGKLRPPDSIAEYLKMLRTHTASWPGPPLEDRQLLQEALASLREPAEKLREAALAKGLVPKPYATLPRAGEGLVFLLSLEVIECAFGDFEEFTEQRVELAQIDSVSAAPIDHQRRSSEQKVAGIQLGHFGAFLKRAWRANDWMWGRIDAVTHLCRILLAEADEATVKKLALDIRLPASAERSTVAASWARKIQKEIIADELPKVAQAVRSDLEEGGARGSFSTQFLEAFEATMGASHGAPTEADLVALLQDERIGEERLVDELGSDLLTRTSMHSLATGTTVIQEGSPKILRGVIGALRFVALLAWGITRTAAGRSRLLNSIAAVLFGAGLVGVAAMAFTDADLGVFGLPAVIAFGAGLLLALARAPFVVIPMLILVVIPTLLDLLPQKQPEWWGSAPWPSLDPKLEWVPLASFILAGLVIGLIHRPGWLVGYRRRVRGRLRTLDGRLMSDWP